jgi:hypothetical protein
MMNRTGASIAIVCAFLLGIGSLILLPAVSLAQEDWRAEFDDICSKTTDSMSLTKAELASLIERCDKLKPRIERLDESTAKVYRRRLKMCRDLYVFVLETPSR